MALKGIKVGSSIIFKGYGEGVPEDQQYLEAGSEYEVVEVEEDKVVVRVSNPNYDKSKKASGTNSKTLDVEVLEEEIEIPEEEKPAKVKAGAKAAPAKAAAKTATKPAAKGKTASKAAETKSRQAAGKPQESAQNEGEEAEEDKLGPLEEEDENILKMVQEAGEGDGLLELAKEVAEESAATDYKLGGILYHVRLDKVYEQVDDRYKEPGGLALYFGEVLKIDYRKAMHLISIYHTINKLGIDPAKVAEIGYTKWTKLYPVLSEDNKDDLLETAEDATVEELADTIKESYVEVGGSKVKGEKRKRLTFKYRLFEDSAEVVKNAIEGCAAAMGYKTQDEAFEHIVTEWATEHPMTKAAAAPAGRRVSAPAAPAAKAAAKTNGKAPPVKARPVARTVARSAARA